MAAFVIVYRSLARTDAICLRSFLDARGFFSLLRNEHHISQSSEMLSLALGGYQILVADTDAREATRLLSAAMEGEFMLDEDFDENQLSISLW